MAVRQTRMHDSIIHESSGMRAIGAAWIFVAACGLAAAGMSADSNPGNQRFFQTSIRPLFKEYCLRCHSTEKKKGDMDLERFSSLSEVLRHPKVWQAVAEQLANNEMPPKDKPQPTAVERERLAG